MGEGGGSSDACRLRARGRQKHGVRTPPSRVSSILKGSFSKSVSTRRPGECGGREGHLQGQVRHPSVACGDTSPYRGGFWDGGPQKGSPARGAGCAGRRRLRGALPLCGGNTPQGLAGSCPAVHGGSARPRGGRDRPPYIAAENGQRSVNGRRFKARRRADASIGPYAGGGWRPGGCGGPEGPCPRVSQGICGGRESAATRKDICRVRCGTPPSPAATPPLAGEAFGMAVPRKAPLQGELDAPEGADRGVHCRFAAEIPRRVWQGLAPVFRRGVRRPGECGYPEGYLQGQARHPSVACGDTSPCRGGFRGGSTQKGSPARGAFQAAVCSKPPPR